MSLLNRQSVNPLTANATAAAAAANVPFDPSEDFSQAQAPAQPSTFAAPAQEVANLPVDLSTPGPAHFAPPAVASLVPAAGAFDDGFDDLTPGFGALPRVKMEAGHFWCDSERVGTEFVAQFIQSKKVFIWRDRRADAPGEAKAAWSNDGVTCQNGLTVEEVRAKWVRDGQPAEEHVMRETREVIAMVLTGPMKDKVVQLSIPQQSVNKMAGYRGQLLATRGRRIPDVLTRVHVGEPIKTKQGSFTPWAFEYAGELDGSAQSPRNLLASHAA